eukprot:CAMPEP_0172560700 /NCGR_PEP_ID=MMETSP1067-20121228/89847_1 /TAXON_ID=265564 ORGANISM="Thalassiosira punctigera, Strain Tpunct2005C2" /NCGR_SAMPLE_ID=MMETSP1067 /ASSEMBLY_ACC=CAM_ASM_000444 /LENGTH=372 /DNA_ID=CAMNT_0013350557 /DNA_START=64 /DNA_END=1182 /DNA_ORIENTATION=+
MRDGSSSVCKTIGGRRDSRKSGRCLLRSLFATLIAAAVGLAALALHFSARIHDGGASRRPRPSSSSSTPVSPAEKSLHDHLIDFHDADAKGNLGTVACPCCGWHGAEMNTCGANTVWARPNCECPVCKSRERHRRVCAMLGGGRIRGSASAGDESDTIMPMLTGPSERRERGVPFRLAHFGPHIQMEKVLNAGGGIDQVSLDFMVETYQYSSLVMHADVTDIPLPSHFADGVVILHVLEHVPDREKAMRELRRILFKTSGWLLVEVPCTRKTLGHKDCRGKEHAETKFRKHADGTTKAYEDRTKCAGQWDHVWAYDCDEFASDLDRSGLSCYSVDNSDPADFGIGAPFVTKFSFIRANGDKHKLYACTRKDE